MTSSVVVVSLRAGDWLAPCLASVRQQADQLVVVDNGSPDAEVSEVGRRFDATIVRSGTNRGFAGGANLGVRRSTGDTVALLNDDAVAAPDWLAASRTVLDRPDVAAVTPKVVLSGWYGEVPVDGAAWSAPGDARLLGRKLVSVTVGGEEVLDRLAGPGVYGLEETVEDGVPTRWRWTRPGTSFYVPVPAPDPGPGPAIVVNGEESVEPRAVCRLINNTGLYLRDDAYAGDRGLESPDDGRWDHVGDTFGVSGTALVARAETFRSVGLLAEPFFAYYEDTDWSWRARRLGLRLAYLPSTSVSHRRSATSTVSLGARVRILGERNRLLAIARNAPAPVVAAEVRRRLVDGPDHGIRREMLKLLPWALATRTALNRRSTVSAAAVWARWAGADTEWDDGPAGTDHRRAGSDDRRAAPGA
jgi:GT2 family glycosyltransferase